MIAPLVQFFAGMFSLFGVDADPGVVTELVTGLVMILAAVWSIFKSNRN